jgi:hypothetical protein
VKTLWQPPQLGVEDTAHIAPRGFPAVMQRHVHLRSFPSTATGDIAPHTNRDAVGNAMQKAAHAFALADGRCSAGEYEEGGLAGIFGVVGMAQNPPADGQHHGSIAADQHSESRLLMLASEAVQQLSVAHPTGVFRPAQLANLVQDAVQPLVRHPPPSVSRSPSSG